MKLREILTRKQAIANGLGVIIDGWPHDIMIDPLVETIGHAPSKRLLSHDEWYEMTMWWSLTYNLCWKADGLPAGDGRTFSRCNFVMYPPGGAFANWETIKCVTGQPLGLFIANCTSTIKTFLFAKKLRYFVEPPSTVTQMCKSRPLMFAAKVWRYFKDTLSKTSAPSNCSRIRISSSRLLSACQVYENGRFRTKIILKAAAFFLEIIKCYFWQNSQIRCEIFTVCRRENLIEITSRVFDRLSSFRTSLIYAQLADRRQTDRDGRHRFKAPCHVVGWSLIRRVHCIPGGTRWWIVATADTSFKKQLITSTWRWYNPAARTSSPVIAAETDMWCLNCFAVWLRILPAPAWTRDNTLEWRRRLHAVFTHDGILGLSDANWCVYTCRVGRERLLKQSKDHEFRYVNHSDASLETTTVVVTLNPQTRPDSAGPDQDGPRPDQAGAAATPHPSAVGRSVTDYRGDVPRFLCESTVDT